MLNATRKIIEYFEDNEKEFNSVIEDLDSWNGYLNGERYWEMYMFDDDNMGRKPSEIAEDVYSGRDEGYPNSSFNPNREYYYYDGLGRLVSADEKDYSDRLDEWFVKDVAENRNHLWLDGKDELNALLDEWEEENYADA